MISYYNVVPHLKKGKQFNLSDIPIPYDDEIKENEQPTEEEVKAQLKEAAEYWKKVDSKRDGKTDH